MTNILRRLNYIDHRPFPTTISFQSSGSINTLHSFTKQQGRKLSEICIKCNKRGTFKERKREKKKEREREKREREREIVLGYYTRVTYYPL